VCFFFPPATGLPFLMRARDLFPPFPFFSWVGSSCCGLFSFWSSWTLFLLFSGRLKADFFFPWPNERDPIPSFFFFLLYLSLGERSYRQSSLFPFSFLPASAGAGAFQPFSPPPPRSAFSAPPFSLPRTRQGIGVNLTFLFFFFPASREQVEST